MGRFSETLMDHWQDPRHRGPLPAADGSGTAALGGGFPTVTLHVRLRGDRVETAHFEATGCGVTIACASVLTQLAEGRSTGACRALSVEDLAAALDGLPPDKHYCASVALEALRRACTPGGGPDTS